MAVATAALSALLAVIGWETRSAAPEPLPRAAEAAPSASSLPSLCPPGTLPDHGVCIPVPQPRASASAGNPRWQVYDRLPKLPDRPADYGRYRYPVTVPGSGPHLLARTSDLRHDGLAIAAEPGAAVRALGLRGQVGPGRVVYVGPLVGQTVITEHTVRDHGRERKYLIVSGGLARSATGVHVGLSVGGATPLGFIGAQDPHLYLEVRRLREGVDVKKLDVKALLDDARSVLCDPRNVLPLK